MKSPASGRFRHFALAALSVVTSFILVPTVQSAVPTGVLKGFGSSSYGQFGNGQMGASVILPQLVGSQAVEVAVGLWHRLYLRSDGTLWTAGLNTSGQLGDGTVVERDNPVLVDSGVKSIAAGPYNSFYIKTMVIKKILVFFGNYR